MGHCDILIIDTYNMIVRSKNKWTKVKDKNLVVSLFLKTLRNSIINFNPSKVIMTLDDYIGNSFRKTLFPEYKSQRVAKNNKDPFGDEFKAQKIKILNIIEQFLPVYTIKYKGYEADDLIAIFCKIFSDDINTIVWSNDFDLVQLQQKFSNVKIWNPRTKDFMPNPTYDTVLYKALTGDKSDNIPGIKGIGPKHAMQAISSQNEFIRIVASRTEKYIEFRKNLKAIDLINSPLEVPYNLTHILKENVSYKKESFQEECRNNGMFDIIKDINNFNECFEQLENRTNSFRKEFFYNKKGENNEDCKES